MLQALLSRLRTLRAPRSPSGRAQQLQHDAERLYAVLNNSASNPSVEQLAHTLNKHLQHEVHRVFHATYKALLDGSTPLQTGVQSRLGYVPLVQSSRVQGAGNGLFVRGEARAGSLLAVFPGLFFNMSDVPSQLSDLAIARYDGVIIDSSHPISINVPSQQQDERGNDVATGQMEHPFATAHYANHGMPNALQFMIDVPRNSLPSHMYDLVPVRAAPKQRSMLSILDKWADLAFIQRVSGSELYTKQGEHVLKTVGLLALRDIHDGEEIRFNYRFNPQAKQLPHWYTDPEPEVSKRRWQQSSVLW